LLNYERQKAPLEKEGVEEKAKARLTTAYNIQQTHSPRPLSEREHPLSRLQYVFARW